MGSAKNAGVENEGANQWRQRLGNFGGWIDAMRKVSWGTEVNQWGPGAKTQDGV